MQKKSDIHKMTFRQILLLCLACMLLAACTPKSSKSTATLPVTPAPNEAAVISELIELEVTGEPADEVVDVQVPPADDAEPLSSEELEALETRLNINIEMDESDRKVVEQYFKYFTHRGRKTFQRYLSRCGGLLPHATEIFKQKGLPEEIVYLAFVESGFNAKAYSRAGAAGVWQFMPYTGRKYGLKQDWWIDERRDPYKSAESAATYLLKLYDDFGDWYLAIAAYNAGEGKIGRAMKKTGAESFFELTQKNHKLSRRARLRKETKHYVPKFLAIVKIMRNLEKLGFDPIDTESCEPVKAIQVKGGTDLLALANDLKIKWKTFYNMNPAFRRQVTPPDYETTVYVPASKASKAMAFLKSDKSRPYAGWIAYKVRSGDSWYRIGRKHGVPVAVLKKINNRRSNLLKPGQRLMIPGSNSTQVAWRSPRAKTRAIAQKRGKYIVKKGDTLYDISRATGVSVKTLLSANGLRSAKQLRAGSKLYIPNKSKKTTIAQKTSKKKGTKTVAYQVRRGESVWTIAKKFGVSYKDVLRWNQLSKRSVLRPGDNLKIYTN
ncbi:LysM peptidoglycan-binding domain-containing protein [Halodesulfovibrio marinisediminis]|uniref:Membrane-bound lytic murein transglycosylase D n=1 Tax=Halodesulfovibrio marinisediminis DSM 17456 TaxID=1121457 RepID=A0A1N6JBH9_9BACT|nr:LysM peptidoglycan-binding domain-containing protein [Halodesulfovibrio marinisediminis]SIO41698.1 membrane-bound lytic murein transglycosylase D [Halodesulfovibrio marinisediminis DSM 17456]